MKCRCAVVVVDGPDEWEKAGFLLAQKKLSQTGKQGRISLILGVGLRRGSIVSMASYT